MRGLVSVLAFVVGVAGLTGCGDVHEVSVPRRGFVVVDDKGLQVAQVNRAETFWRAVEQNNLAVWQRARWLDAAKENAAARGISDALVPSSNRKKGTLDGVAVPRAAAPIGNTGWGPCGGEYPPCYRVGTESATAGLYNAYNPTGCGGNGCYGKWQFSGEWAGKLGLPQDLSTATPAQQDEAARILWANGAGCSNWDAC